MLWEGVCPPLIFIVEQVCQFRFGVFYNCKYQCASINVKIEKFWCGLTINDVNGLGFCKRQTFVMFVDCYRRYLFTASPVACPHFWHLGIPHPQSEAISPGWNRVLRGGLTRMINACFRLGIFRGSKVFRSFVSVLSWNKCQSVDCIENFPIYEELFCWNAQGLNGEKSSCSEY